MFDRIILQPQRYQATSFDAMNNTVLSTNACAFCANEQPWLTANHSVKRLLPGGNAQPRSRLPAIAFEFGQWRGNQLD